MKKKIVLIAVCALVLIVAFLLYPAKVEKSYAGAAFSNLEDNSFAPCSLSLSGRLHTRFLPNAEYKGTFSLSVNGQSLFEDASITARMGADGPSFITCLTDDGYTIPGYFVAPRSFDWLYIRLKPADGDHGSCGDGGAGHGGEAIRWGLCGAKRVYAAGLLKQVCRGRTEGGEKL